jgi:RNA polymerase sigma factor (sigma-70 family)
MNANSYDDDAITILIEGVKTGDEEAIQRIWKQYYEKLIHLARDKVAASPAYFADEDDVVQSALVSFINRAQKGQFPRLDDRDSLWKLLITITLNKVRALARKEGRRIEILQREQENFLKGEPSVEVAVEMADQIERLMSLLEDPMLREVAVAKLEGATNKEVSQRIGKSIPTVERKLRLVRTLWAAEMAEPT